MRSLGLNPSEQEVIDIPNYITRKGLIFFTDFCQLVLKWFRDDPSEQEYFQQYMFRVFMMHKTFQIQISYSIFQVMCGTDNYSNEFRAKKYKQENHFLSKVKGLIIFWT